MFVILCKSTSWVDNPDISVSNMQGIQFRNKLTYTIKIICSTIYTSTGE